MPSLSEVERRALLSEALPLVATFMHGTTVPLTSRGVGAGDHEPDPDFTHFLATVRARHALGCAMHLDDVLPRVERAASSESRSSRVLSRGVIRGRLDLPAYIRTRRRQEGPNREFPLIVTESFPDTPENRLGAWLLRSLRAALSGKDFRQTSAEQEAARRARVWLAGRLRGEPWSAVAVSWHVLRLRRETAHRIRRRRTGNERGYERLVEVVDDWLLPPGSLGGDRLSTLITGLMAFPASDEFWERVFEIWCLRLVARALEAIGFTAIEPVSGLSTSSGEVFRFARGDRTASVWFQRQKPMGRPSWSYDGGGPLTGIPDIVVTTDDRPPFVIDAKLRWATSTRSEETYKMLGYAENFRASPASGFFGALIFVGPETSGIDLSGPDNGRLALLTHGGDFDRLIELLSARIVPWLS
ncbi:MAG TPA: hypothetical protein VN758_09320 [Solirubrobacterales bacterium]|nr:hypothetical protein [Solirubrobacterales bacterium]